MDHTGKLERDEFTEVYENLLGQGYKLGTLDETLKQVDLSGDGHVNCAYGSGGVVLGAGFLTSASCGPCVRRQRVFGVYDFQRRT